MAQKVLFSACMKIAALYTANLLLILTLHSTALGQGSTPQRGYQPGGSYALSDIETINTTNGNLMLNLPLGRLAPGRGGFSGQLNLHYDSKLYDSKTQWYQDWEHLVGGEPHIAIRNMLVTNNQGGWHYGTGYELQLIDRMSQYPPEIAPQYPATETIRHYKIKVAFPDGSLREFLPRGFGSPMEEGYYDIRPDGWQATFNGSYVEDVPSLTSTLTYYTFDGTYIKLEVQHDSDGNWWNNPWTLYFPDGTKVSNYGSRISDRNGNYVEFSNVTYNGHLATQLIDQLGRKIVIDWEGISDGDVIHVPGVGGADLVYQIHWKGIQVYKTYSTVINDHYSPEGYPDMLGSQFVVSEIDLPSESGGLKYLFGYNAADQSSCCPPSYGWGELNSVTTPTGAQAQYQYQLDGQNGPGLAYTWDIVLRNQITQKTLTYQQQYDGNSTPVTETWSYDLATGTIVNPDGGIVTQLNDAQRNYRTQQPDGTVIEKLWQANRPPGFPVTSALDQYTGIDAYDPARVNGYVKTEFTSIRDAGGNLSKTAIKDYNYDKNGNVTRVAEYDWVDYSSVPRSGLWSLPTGIPANAVLKRVTTNTLARSTPDASDTSSNVADSYWNSTSPSLRNALASSEVSNGSATLSRTEFFYDNAATTGNLTQQKTWDSTKGAYSNPLSAGNSIAVSHQYDSYGNPTLTTDARGYQTQFVYGSVGGFTSLYPTQVKTAYQTSVQRTETREYDFSTSLVTRVTDVDNNVASSTSYDVFGRPTLVKAAEGKPEETRTSTYYSDVDRRVTVKSDLNTVGDEKLVSIQHYDQLGRVRLTRQLEDAATQSATDETTGIKVQTRYQYSGNFSYVLSSNPYCAATSSAAGGETTMGWTRSKSDNGGRVIEVQTFGGASAPTPWGANTSGTGTISTSYDANFTTVTDQAGKLRRSTVNGLGQLIRVDEPDATGSLGTTTSPMQPTNYTYDALANLTQVVQASQTGSQMRTFLYSSLGRLTSVTNPESGTVTYQYDNNSNLTFKTDARGVVTENRYDALNRVTTILYRINGQPDPNTGDVEYLYDNATNGKGRLWLTYRWGAKPSHTAVGLYDALGRVTQLYQLFGDGQGGWSAGYAINRSYNRAGGVISQSYPSGHSVTYDYDAAGRATSLTGNLGDGVQRTYSTGISYVASGALKQEQFGTTAPVYNKLFYNSRLQLAEILASTTGGDSSWNRGKIVNGYSLQCSGASCNATDNNGNLRRQQVYIPADDQVSSSTTWYQQYDYDNLNRLQRVQEYTPSLVWQQEYVYDRWGNRTIHQTNTWGTGINKKDFTVNTATNQLGKPAGQSGTMTYDLAGNLITDSYIGYGSATFDGDNRIVAAQDSYAGWSYYTYNADGQRVRRKINNQETWQIYGIEGELLAEYPANAAVGSPQKEYGYRNGQLLVTANAAPVNVALAANGSTATASSTLSPYVPAYVINGSRRAINNEVWLDSTYASFPDWVQVDFNGSKTISEIDVITQQDDPQNPIEPTLTQTFSLYGITAYDVQYWTGSAWATVPGGSVTGNNKVWRQFSFSPITTSKIRVMINTGADNAFSRVVEVEAWTSSSTGNINWLVTDHLGTPRMIFDQSGSLANVKRHDYLPFGEELFAPTGLRTSTLGYSGDGVRQQFTSKERDIETGLDYFGYRYFATTQGRWTSVDPMIDFERNTREPQAWNLYQYCVNSPLTRTDPDGRQDSVRLNGNQAIEKELRKNGFNEKQIKQFMEEYRRTQGKVLVSMLAGAVVGAAGRPVVEAFLIWAARNPDKVEQAGQMALEAAGGPPSLIPASNSRLRATEVDSLTRLSKQLGSTLIESSHVGEEVIVAGTNKTIDVMGHGSFYTHPQFKMSEFFNSIKEHVTSSVTYIAIDLKGASKQQIAEITAYVNSLDTALRGKVIYISP